MSLSEILSQALCRRLALTLVHFLWQGLAVAALVALAVRVLGLRSGRQRYVANLAAFLVLAACPLVTFALVGAAQPAAAPTSMATLSESAGAATATANLESSPGAQASQSVEGGAGGASVLQRLLGARLTSGVCFWLMAAWLAGVLVMTGKLALGFFGIHRWRANLSSLPPERASGIKALSSAMGLAGFDRIFVSARAGRAVAIGLLKPMVLLPASLVTGMSGEMLEAIVAHELAHIRRHDLWVITFQRIVEALLFYHPAVWWLSARLDCQRENACDDMVVAAGCGRDDYAETLVRAAEFVEGKHVALAAAATSSIKRRVMRLLAPAHGDCGRTGASALAVMLLAAGLLALAFLPGSLSAGEAPGDSKPDAGKTGLVATLSNGDQVELLGVSYHGREGSRWWAPDGRVLDGALLDVSEQKEQPTESLAVYEFALRVPNKPMPGGHVGFRSNIKGRHGAASWGGRKDYKQIATLKAVASRVPREDKTTTLVVGVASGEWLLMASPLPYKGHGNFSVRSVEEDGQFLIIRAIVVEGRPLVIVSDNTKNVDRRVVAITFDGKEHVANMTSTWKASCSQLIARFGDLHTDEIKEFRFLTRAYEWIEFRNISLEPGVTTEPEVAPRSPNTPEDDERNKV